jgi:UDP-N-acetylmuramoyl-L-alanyl-D-glutamate--2,6-diaminopimelate ligase
MLNRRLWFWRRNECGPMDNPTRPITDLKLGGLVRPLGAVDALMISGLSVDSRKTKPGHLFAAMPGTQVHGATFVSFAQRMGAVAVLTDAEGVALLEAEFGALPLPVLVADDPRRALAYAAAHWFGAQPANMVAVTGTNGKTSVSNFARQIFEALGETAVNFGTTGVEGAVTAPLSHTTPEPLTLHKLLADLTAQGVTHAAMEASSHGLAQQRLAAVRLKAAAFSNLTRDHLDYHPTVESYFAAKALLFTEVLPANGCAVINIDDPFGVRLAEMATARGQRVLRVGRDPSADLRIRATRFDADGQDLRFEWQGSSHVSRLGLIGGFQAGNALLAAGLAIGCGAPPNDVFSALEQLGTVRGRMQLAATRENGAKVFVDYAHTPDALKTALDALRPHVLGRLIVVFGAGGDRDKGKRPLMGAAAAEHADICIVTDDNPRNEDPASIRATVLAACPEAVEVGDRAEAILRGIDAAQAGDAVLIAGKGHESGQTVGGDVLPFDDVEQASMATKALDGLGL